MCIFWILNLPYSYFLRTMSFFLYLTPILLSSSARRKDGVRRDLPHGGHGAFLRGVAGGHEKTLA